MDRRENNQQIERTSGTKRTVSTVLETSYTTFFVRMETIYRHVQLVFSNWGFKQLGIKNT